METTIIEDFKKGSYRGVDIAVCHMGCVSKGRTGEVRKTL